MNESRDQDKACSMSASDAEGRTDLCCCYVIDDNGELDDPCFQPVDDCCCCE